MTLLINELNHKLKEILDKRIEDFSLRSLQVNENLIDFCSNDYLSFARLSALQEKVKKITENLFYLAGSTGSRSISGNSAFAEELEKQIASFHHAPAGLLFNSGYDANVGLFSCIAAKGDTIICDELIHASIIDGCRLSYATRYKFAHNNLEDLEKKLRQATGTIFVAVESVYSMDGDMAPLKEIAELCKNYNANLIVDEAHATGIFGENGKGLVNQCDLEEAVFARIHTFGKAIGCHGAIVLGNELLRKYLINFARSFIFTTALPFHSLVTIKCAYEQLADSNFTNSHLHLLIKHFKNNFENKGTTYLINSDSPIQSVVIKGNKKTKAVSQQLQSKGFDVRAILTPSVPIGKERLRISLHLHNTVEQIDNLLTALKEILHS